MKYSVIKLIATVAVLAVTAGKVSAACDKSSIKGNFAGESFFPETENYWPTHAAMMINFNGNGKLTIKKIIEGANETLAVGNGSGSYDVWPNCTGVANITIMANGLVVGKGKMDFVIGGTRSAPEIFGAYKDSNQNTTGNVHLIKSSL